MNLEKLTKPLEDPSQAKLFSRKFIEVFSTPAFGAISKTEVDNLVFGLLIEVDALDPKSQVYEIARDLNITPAKARNLLFQWQLRSMGDGVTLKDDIVAALRSVRFTNEGNILVFGIESPLLREELRSRLKRMGVYPDASFSSEIVRLSVEHFVEFLDSFLDKKKKAAMHQALIKDGQMKDKNFKAVAFRILKGIAKKLVGEGVDELGNPFGDAVQGLMTDDADSVKAAIDGIDLSDEALA